MGTPAKGRADYYKEGSFNAVCSECGRKRKADELERNWQGLYRCPEHNEPRQPQDFARGVPDIQTVPWAQIPATNNLGGGVFVHTCSINTQSAIPGYSVPGCMIPGNSHYDPYGL